MNSLAIGDTAGGAELFAISIALRLPEEEFETLVCSLWRSGSAAEQRWMEVLSSRGIRVEFLCDNNCSQIKSFRAQRACPGALRKLWKFVSQFAPELINSHTERLDVMAMLVRCLHPLHPAAVRTMHTELQWHHNRLLGAMLSLFYPLAFSTEIAVSAAIDAKLRRRLLAAAGEVLLCHNGIPEELFTLRKLPQEITWRSPVRLLAVGRLVEQKGMRVLLEALPAVRRRFDAELSIVGDGPLRRELFQRSSAADLEGAVKFLGSRSDVAQLMQDSDLLILPSLWEGFPTVLLEAMACGLPVVATDVSGSRELVTEATGMLVPPNNSQALAQAIVAVLDHPQRACKRAHAAQLAARRYTIQSAADFYAGVYAKLTRGGR